MEGTIDFGEKDQIIQKSVGAILLATGAQLYDLSQVTQLGYGKFPEVYNNFEFERILAGNGPTEGQLLTKDGRVPNRIAIVHCAGSLDEKHLSHCSAVCCLGALKFNAIIGHKTHGTEIVHYYKTIVTPGKEDFACYRNAQNQPHSTFVQYVNPEDLLVSSGTEEGALSINCKTAAGQENREFDMVVLMAGLTTSSRAKRLSEILEVNLDSAGFFEELNGRSEIASSKVRGIYLAGNCQQPGDIGRSMMQGAAAAGNVLAALVEGRQLAIEPATAEVDAERCSGCRTCVPVCPYKAIEFLDADSVAKVNAVLCVGCGTCVAACPAGSIQGHHFTNDEIYAEIEALLR